MSEAARAKPTALEVVRDPGGRVALTRRSPSFFGTYYLGLDYAEHQDRWASLCHRARRLLLLAPRDHGKTESVVRVYAGSRIATNRKTRVLVVSKTKDEARKRVEQVKSDLEYNSKIREDFGTFNPRMVMQERGHGPVRGEHVKAGRWTSAQFYVSGRGNSRDATMEGVGVLGAITGGHFDLIILDDPVEDVDAHSQAKRDAIWRWFQATIEELAEPHTQILIVGTRKHADDLYGRIIRTDQTYDVVTDKAIKDSGWLRTGQWEYTYTRGETGRLVASGVRIKGKRPEVLWPEKWSIENLLLKYKKNSVLFFRENQNEIVDDAKTVYKRAFFTGGTVEGIPGKVFPGCREPRFVLNEPGTVYVPHPELGHLHVLQAWDLSLVDDREKAEKEDSDFTVGLTFGYDPVTEDRWLLGFYRQRGILPSQVTGGIKTECALYGGGGNVKFVAIEKNSFGRLHELKLRATTALPLVGHTTTGRNKADPEDGIVRLVGVLENGKWHLPYGNDYSQQVAQLIENEFVGFGVEDHDDIVLAFWIAECLIDRYERFLVTQRAQVESRKMGRPSIGTRPSAAASR